MEESREWSEYVLWEHEKKPSWIPKVIVAIEEICDHLHHGPKETYFVAWLAAKDTKLLVFHCPRSLLLES
jgi:hypothetical protein